MLFRYLALKIFYTMETMVLEHDMNLCCVVARSFPDGIKDAFVSLEARAGSDRILFGISKPEKNAIVYKAAALESHDGEAQALGLAPFTIRKGKYLTETVEDWMKDERRIGKTFGKLLNDKRLDPQSSCIEWYKGDNVICMVRLAD